MNLKNIICKEFSIEVSELEGKSQCRNLVDARRVYSLLATYVNKLTLKEVGKDLNRDHSSIIYQRRTASELLSTDYNFRDKFETIKTLYLNENSN